MPRDHAPIIGRTGERICAWFVPIAALAAGATTLTLIARAAAAIHGAHP